jgi:four helix bundle protein
MKQTTNHPRSNFHAFQVAMQAISLLPPLAARIAAADRSLADQLRRAAASIVLNLDEGAGRRGRDQAHFYRIAFGSARESRTTLDVAVAFGYLGADEIASAWALLDRVAAMLWRLTR